MESYVTSYSGAEDATKQAMTQEKLNACIKSLHDLVDTFEPLETVQEYGEMIIEDQDYYAGFNKQFDPPEKESPILVQIGNLILNIGLLDIKGVFTTTKPINTESNIDIFRINSIEQHVYIGEWHESTPPDKPENSDEIYNTHNVNDITTDNNGAKLSDIGTIDYHKAIYYYNLVLESEPIQGGLNYRYRWVGNMQTVRYSQSTLIRTIDLSKFKLNILRRYKKNVSRTSAN